MDETDLKILKAVMANARINWSDLAKQLRVSGPTVAERVRRLEARGAIRGYTAMVDPEAVGCGMTALIAVTLEHPKHRAAFLKLVAGLVEIQECHHTAGEDDYLLKVRCGGARELESLISDRIKSLKGVLRTRTTVVLSTVKESSVLPVRGV